VRAAYHRDCEACPVIRRSLLLLMTLVFGCSALAKDYGVQGTSWPVIEPDMLKQIETRLKAMEASGEIDRVNRGMQKRAAQMVRRPTPVSGIVSATRLRRWTIDPGYTAPNDVRDAAGNIIVRAGTYVNPLDYVKIRQKLIFIDGDDKAQLLWAMRNSTATTTKLILIKGNPFDMMKPLQRRLYFDQQGYLVQKFGIQAVPATVEQQGKKMLITEIPVSAKIASAGVRP
jgi:conjugal transfer pilus assembly protein TraW